MASFIVKYELISPWFGGERISQVRSNDAAKGEESIYAALVCISQTQ